MPQLTDEELMAIASAPSQVGIQFEGTTGRSARNNNPFNLEYRPGSYQEQYGATLEPAPHSRFAVFPDMMSGYLAGLDQIKIDQARGHTLASFVNKFAPPHQNPTQQLIGQYAQAVGATPNTPLSQIPPEKLAGPMMARESSTRLVNYGGGQQQGLTDEELMAIAGTGAAKPSLTLGQEAALPEAPPDEAQAAMGLLQPQGEVPIALQSLESNIGGFAKGFLDYLPKGITENAPLMGMMSGGATGARLGAMAGPLGALGGGVVGAGLGGMMGRQGQSMMKVAQGEQLPPPGEQLIATGKQGLSSATEWAAGEGISAGIAKAFAPVKRAYDRLKMSSQMANEIESMVKKGIPVSPDIQNPAWQTKLYQWWVEKLPFGKKITDTYRWDTAKGINAMRDNFLKKSGYPAPRTVEEITALKETRKGLYGKALEEAGASVIPMPATKEVIQNLPKEALATSYYQKVLKPKFIRDGQLVDGMTFADVNDAFIPTKIWGAKFDPKKMPAGQMKWRDDLVAAMKQDVGAFDAAQSTKVLKSYESAHKMGEVIRGSDKSNFLQDLLDRSTTNFELQEFFNPGKFSGILNGEGKRYFLKNFTKSERDVITNFAQKMELVGQDLARLQKPGPGLGTLGPMAGAAYYSPGIAVPMGFPLFTSWSLMKPSGLVRRWLTSGLMPGRTIASGGIGAKIGLSEPIDKEMGVREND